MILQNWWFTTLMGVKSPMAPPLRGEKKTDVVVIGGGTAGLSAALRLSQAGVKTVLLDPSKNIIPGLCYAFASPAFASLSGYRYGRVWLQSSKMR